MKKLVKGEKVMVYQDSLTCQKTEGVATLVKNLNVTQTNCEYWTVKFESDGAKVDRFINVETH